MANRVEKFLLNKDVPKAEQVVEAPAFSLTKVLGTGAVIVGPLTTLIIEGVTDADIGTVHYVALALGLLGFLAVTAAADVLARGIATAAEKNAGAVEKAAEKSAESAEKAAVKNAEAVASQTATAQAGLARLTAFKQPVDGRRVAQGADVPIKLLGIAHGTKPFFLVKEGDEVKWLREKEVTIP